MACKIVSLRIISIYMALYCSISGAMARMPKGYPFINDKTIESERYEVRNINKASWAEHVLFDTANNHLIVSTGWIDAEYWKINEKGYVIDEYSHNSSLLLSGILFDEHSYVDWAITGNKVPQKYSKIIDADVLSEDEFNQYYNSADEVEYDEFYDETKQVRIYLKIKNKWMVLETTKRIDEFDGYANSDYHEVTSKRYPKKQKNRLKVLTGGRSTLWDDSTSKIFIKHFDKKGSSSRPFLDINNRGWDGYYGVGYFQVNIQDEQLYFKAQTAKMDSSFYPAIDIYMVPEQYRFKFEPVLIKVNAATRYRRPPDEIGMYVLRKKISTTDEAIANFEKKGVSFGTYLFHNKKFNWKPVFTGFSNRSSEIRQINYFNNVTEPFNDQLTSEPASKKRAMPKEIIFDWIIPKNITGAMSILFDGTFYQWSAPHKSIYFDLVFDRTETIEAFQLLSGNDELIKIELRMEKLDDNSHLLSAWIGNGIQVVKLKNATLKTQNNNIDFDENELRQRFKNVRMNKAYQAALNDASRLPEYFLITEDVAKNSDDAGDYAHLFANQTTKLLLKHFSTSTFVNAKKLLTHYITEIVPYSELSKKTNDVASLGLVYCISSNDDAMCKKIFDELLPRLKISKLDNEVLLFNLACYYSINNEKENMLKSIKQAIKYGKATEEFMEDNDFKHYWEDADFLNAVKK